MKSTRHWVAAILLMSAAAVGAKDDAPIRLAFNIAEQPLDAALTDFAQATGLQLLVLSDIAHERKAPKVAGELTPEAALQRLLEQSGLTYQFVNAKTVAISTVDALRPTTSIGGAPADLNASEEFRLAQAEPRAASTAASDGIGLDSQAARSVPEVLVEGSRALNMDIQRSRDDAQPYVVFGREAIERAGSQTLQDFLQTRLTSNSIGSSPSQSTLGDSRSIINLRGLGPNQTLILVDGHRVAPSNGGAAGQADINGIPLAAIERIEVLPTTSSGAYGGSATGGVVNIILRRDYTGVETKLTYGNSFESGGGSRRVDLSAGTSLNGGSTSLLFTGSYSDSNRLLAEDRDFLQDGRQRVLEKNRATFYSPTSPPPLGATTNIRSTTGVPLTLKPAFGGGQVGSSMTSVPYGYDGPASDNGAALIANAGVYNLDLANTAQGGAGLRQSLYNTPTLKSVRASVQHDFGSSLRAFLDLSRSENLGKTVTNNTTGTFTLARTAVGNPFNQAIQVTTPTYGADDVSRAVNNDTRAVGGLIFSLPRDWKAEVDYTWDKNHVESVQAPNSITTAGSSAVTTGTLNVFRDTNEFPIDFSQFLGFRPTVLPTNSVMRDLAFRVGGALPWKLPGGSISATALLERRKDSLDDYITLSSTTSGSFGAARSQTINSAYVETGLPLVSSLNDMPGISALDVTLSVRRDDYTLNGSEDMPFNPTDPPTTPSNRTKDNFSSTDYTAALKYAPVRGVSLRGSYGTGFQPPALNQLVAAAPIDLPLNAIFGLTDPLRGDEPVGVVTVLSGGNPNLKPEQSKSTSFGVVFEPTFAPGLRASIDWVRIQKNDNVTAFAAEQSTIANEAFLPGIITRGPASGGFAVGPIIELNSQFLNATRQDVEAYDIALDYQLDDVLGGRLIFSGNGTHTISNEQELIPTLPGIQYAGSSGYTKWLANGTLTYEVRSWTAAWTTRFMNGYRVLTTGAFVPALGSSSIESQSYHDISLRYRFGDLAPLEVLSKTEFQLSVVNVFNKTPPYTATPPYYSGLGDPRLATYYLSVRKNFF